MRIINNTTDSIRHTGTQMLISVVYLIAFYFCFFSWLFSHTHTVISEVLELSELQQELQQRLNNNNNNNNNTIHNSPLFLERHGAKANELMRTRDSSEMLEPSSNFFKSFRLIHLHSHSYTHTPATQRAREHWEICVSLCMYVHDGDESHSRVGGIATIHNTYV